MFEYSKTFVLFPPHIPCHPLSIIRILHILHLKVVSFGFQYRQQICRSRVHIHFPKYTPNIELRFTAGHWKIDLSPNHFSFIAVFIFQVGAPLSDIFEEIKIEIYYYRKKFQWPASHIRHVIAHLNAMITFVTFFANTFSILYFLISIEKKKKKNPQFVWRHSSYAFVIIVCQTATDDMTLCISHTASHRSVERQKTAE